MGVPEDTLTGAGDPLAPGVSHALARERTAAISGVTYALQLRIGEAAAAPIEGEVHIGFELREAARVVVDFAGAAGNVRAVECAGRPVPFTAVHNHIVIGADRTVAGPNALTLRFTAVDAAVHHRDGFLYTLFVPARAHTLFPCFDQPDLKARVSLCLDLPEGWSAVANGVEVEEPDGRIHRFEETPPISTYLIAFAAGRLREEPVRSGRWRFRVFHACDDAARVARNLPAVADLHAAALDWLGEHTGVPYPFGAFDLLLVPSFQFGGMEHPGAVFYQEASLLLPEAATAEEQRNRAHLIAHETAHMWFGNLVTMPWFDDVWLKEVFANLMAEKVLAGRESGAAARLRFYLAHYPPAYDVDRTEGAHPIRQPLDNLARASELYGPIAYQKSPIAFRDLERRMGEARFRTAVRALLRDHAWRAAGWPELRRGCELAYGQPLVGWSHGWIETAGRPDISLPQAWPSADYGRVVLDATGARDLLAARSGAATLDRIADPEQRAVSWMALWEAVCDGVLPARRFATALLERVPAEGERLLRDWLAALLHRVFWRWLPDDDRRALAPDVELMCRAALASASHPEERRAWLGRLSGLTSTPDGVAWLRDVWSARACLGQALGPLDEIALAEALCVLDGERASTVLDVQRGRVTDTGARARLDYLAPALHGDRDGHRAMVAGFAGPARRQPEVWTLDALAWIHHPLRGTDAVPLIGPCLRLLPAAQATGDIFLPRRWAHAVLRGHTTVGAADAVERVLTLDALTAFHRRLVLEAADDLRRIMRRGRYSRNGGTTGVAAHGEGGGT